MKRTIARNSNNNSRNSNPSDTSKKDATMKRTITRNNNSRNSNPSDTSKKDATMKRTITRNNNSRNSNPSDTSKKDAALAALKALGIDAAALFGNTAAPKSESAKDTEKQPKADRAYEIPTIGADFTKNAIYAAPKSESAIAYINAAKALCSDTLENLTAPIASDIKTIAAKAEKDGGASLKNDLLTLANAWKIPPQSMRVIMQLCAPVVACCNPETDDIARRAYGMARANSLMGSACNMLMYTKAIDKDGAIPFKRVAHNLTALGLDFTERMTIDDCDFCESDKDFEKLVKLCDMWLCKCERLAPKDPAPQKGRGKKTSASDTAAPKDDGKKAAALAALAALGIDAAALFGK